MKLSEEGDKGWEMRSGRDGASSERVTDETLVPEMEGKTSTASESSLSKGKNQLKKNVVVSR